MQADEVSQFTSATVETSVTFRKLNEYIYDALPVDFEDDAATVITHMVGDGKHETHRDQNADPGNNNNFVPNIKTHNLGDDESFDLVYKGRKSVADDGLHKKMNRSRRTPLSHASSRSTSSRSTSSNSSKASKSEQQHQALNTAPKKFNNKANLTGDVSLDLVLERLSKTEPEVALPPKAAWESKVKYLATQIDLERDNAVKLVDIERMLEKKKIRARQNTEQAKWKTRVRDLESLLEEKKKAKDEKLRKLAVILEALKKEKNEKRKYEKPSDEGAQGRWASKAINTPADRTHKSFFKGQSLLFRPRQ